MGSSGSTCYDSGMYSGGCGGTKDARGFTQRHTNKKHFMKGETFTKCGQCTASVSWSMSQRDPAPKK